MSAYGVNAASRPDVMQFDVRQAVAWRQTKSLSDIHSKLLDYPPGRYGHTLCNLQKLF